jgi:hypothetical protein
MDKKEPVKIETETVETYRNVKTGQVYEDEKEARFDLTAKPEDIVKDVTVTITNKGLDLLQKVMQNANKPKT